jgi:hypothetical protein
MFFANREKLFLAKDTDKQIWDKNVPHKSVRNNAQKTLTDLEKKACQLSRYSM